mgnify:CR=1 FL=1
MENKSLRFYAIMALWVVLFVLLFVSNRRVDLKTDINKSTSVSVSYTHLTLPTKLEV